MRRLDEIFEPHRKEDSPCCVWFNDEADDDQTSQHTSTGTPYCFLSYAEAHLLIYVHRKWLKEHFIRPEIEIEIGSASASVVAYVSSSNVDFYLSVLACASPSVPATPVLLNTRWSESEIVGVLRSSKPTDTTLLLYSPDLEDTANKVKAILMHSQSIICLPIPDFSSRKRNSRVTDVHEPNPTSTTSRVDSNQLSSDDAMIVFTSGTSGTPKGARLSHRAILLQAYAKTQNPCHYDNDTRLLGTTVPFYHVGGLSSTLALWMAGGVLVLSTKPRPSFDPCQVLRTLSVETLFATNALVVVPTMLYNLEQFLKQGNRSCVFDSVRLILIGGQSISKDGLAFVRRVFPNARIVQTFACTEAASSLTFLDINDSARNSPPIPGNLAGDCVGYSPPHVRLGLYDNNVTIVAPYHLGQISFQGPCTMNGYWNRQGSYSSSLDETHWFISNDLGFWDATGCLYFAGRTTDSIRTGGETVMASEVERVLVQHPDIEEVAVFALRDARYGETVCCAIVSNVPAAPELGDVRGWCKAHGLAGFKRPTRVFRLKNLPKNASGKVLKYRLVECFSAKEFPSKL